MKLAVVVLALALVACASATPSHRNFVVSEASPVLTLEIDSTFAELAPLKFPIENLTNVERRIFVEAGEDRVIQRLVIVQFERVQQGSDFRFVYPSTPPRQFGNETYRYGTFAADYEKMGQREPLKEAGKTREYLKSKGYTVPRLFRTGRLARVTDPEGLTEVIIFYMESADANPPAGPPDEEGSWALSDEESAALTARMDATIKVLRG
jgi:hypothetical protein